MAKLYELVQALEEFEFVIDPETGEIMNGDELDALQLEKYEKVENIALYVKNLDADALAFGNEEKAFAERRRTAQRKAQWLREYLDRCLDGEIFESEKARITFRKSEAVDVVNVDAIPAEFMEVKKAPRKAEIKKALKDGADVPGAVLVTRRNMMIK